MIYIDDTDPIGTLEPSFPTRDVTIKRNVDAKQLYELISEIGRGKFGTVYKCKEKSTKLELAAKFVPIPKREDRRNVEREVEIMNLLQHPLIIQLYAAYEYQKMMCVVLELIEGGELFDRVVDDDFVLTERVCTIFIRQVCEAMQFIHRNNILHLDLKPENILCLTKQGNRIKIIDFGLARKYDPDKKLQILFGTPEFVAPEVVNFDCISFGTDMWSVGVICYVLLSGLSPFMGETDIETMANVTIAKYDFDDEAFSNISQEALDFISKLLVKDMNSRMTATECLEHKWLERRTKSVPSPLDQPQTILKPNETVKVEPSLLTEQLIIQPPPKYTTTPPTPPPVTPEQPPPPSQPILPSSPVPLAATVTSTITTPKPPPPPETISTEELPKPPSPPSKKKELLEQAKDNLKTFIERWEEHPNSPYVFDSGSYLIAPIHLDSSANATKGSSNVSSRACSPSPCGSISDEMEITKIQTENEQSNKKIISVNTNDKNNNVENVTNNKNNIDDNKTLKNNNLREYLHSFDRRNSDTNYILGRQQSSEKVNLAEEIRKLSDHLLMLAEINTKLGKENEEGLKQQKQIKSRTNSTSDKLETIQESIATKSPSESSSDNKNSQVTTVKTTTVRSTSAIESSDNKSSKPTTKSKKISTLSVRLQQSLDETPKLTTKTSKKNKTTTTASSTTINTTVTTTSSIETSKAQNLEDRASKLINGFKQQLLSTSSSSTNLISGVPWPITNKRTKFRINQMSRDVPIGSPDTHQPIDLEDAANTTKDCLLHLLEKYNENDRKSKNGPIGRHQSISVDWNITDNLEYQSMSSINAFFRRHPTQGSYVRQLQAQLEAKSKQT